MSETEIIQGSLSDPVAPFVTVCVPVRNGSKKHWGKNGRDKKAIRGE